MDHAWPLLDYSLIPNHVAGSCPIVVSDAAGSYSVLSNGVETPKKMRILPSRETQGFVLFDSDKENGSSASNTDMDATPKMLKPMIGHPRYHSPLVRQSSSQDEGSPWTASREDSERLQSAILSADDSALDGLFDAEPSDSPLSRSPASHSPVSHSPANHSPAGSPTTSWKSPFVKNSKTGSFRRKKSQDSTSMCTPPPKMAWDVEDIDKLPSQPSLPQQSLQQMASCSSSIDIEEPLTVRKDKRSMSMPSPILPRSNSTELQTSSPKLSVANAAGKKSSFTLKGFQRTSEGSIDPLKKSSLKKKWRKDQMGVKALYQEVQQGNMKLVKELLQKQHMDLSLVNSDGLTALDLALVLGNPDISSLLQMHGARRNPEFVNEPTALSICLVNMGNKAKVKAMYLQQSLALMSLNEGARETQQYKEYGDLHMRWMERMQAISHMRETYHKTPLPEPPCNVTVAAAGSTSLLVQFEKPCSKTYDAITGYKVEWSDTPLFEHVLGEIGCEGPSQYQVIIGGLETGNQYYVRVMACNIKGCGRPAHPEPAYAVPSNWREVDDTEARTTDKWDELDSILTELLRSQETKESSDVNSNITKELIKKNTGRRLSLKSFFPSVPKFQKSLKPGLYLACVIYNEDKVLVTSSNHIPVVEVCEAFTASNLATHFQWFCKLATQWQDVASSLSDLEKVETSGVWTVREHLLHAIALMQSTLSLRDLGQPYFCPVEDKNGCVIFVTVFKAESKNSVSTSATRWTNLSKFDRDDVSKDTSLSATDLLSSRVREMISYEQCTSQPLEGGLYLCYLRLRSSLDVIDVLTPAATPSCLPHVKISDNSNVSREEWQAVKNMDSSKKWSRHQTSFVTKLIEGSQRLADMHGYSLEDTQHHRLYDAEVIELNAHVSVIVIMPPRDQFCGLPGQTSGNEAMYAQKYIPLQTFEMLNMGVYMPELMRPYCRAACLLEVSNCVAQYNQRQALSNDEISAAREVSAFVSGLQKRLTETWRSMRWLCDLISCARSRADGLTLHALTEARRMQDSLCDTTRDNARTTPISKKSRNISTSNGSISKGLLETSSTSGRRRTDLSRGSSQESLRSSDSHETCSITSVDSLERNIQQIIEETCVETSDLPRSCRIHTAFQCGTAPDASYEMDIESHTSAEQAVEFLLRQLSASGDCRGALPGLRDCYLVAVIGNRERILRDSFFIRQLQKPWTQGRLYVRLRKETLAALEIEHSVTQ